MSYEVVRTYFYYGITYRQKMKTAYNKTTNKKGDTMLHIYYYEPCNKRPLKTYIIPESSLLFLLCERDNGVIAHLKNGDTVEGGAYTFKTVYPEGEEDASRSS